MKWVFRIVSTRIYININSFNFQFCDFRHRNSDGKNDIGIGNINFYWKYFSKNNFNTNY